MRISICNELGLTTYIAGKGVIRELYLVEIQGKTCIASKKIDTKAVAHGDGFVYYPQSPVWYVNLPVWGVEIPFPLHELIDDYGIVVEAVDFKADRAN